jgi:beta-xylosidase
VPITSTLKRLAALALAAAAVTAPSPAPAAGSDVFVPVFRTDFPDPFILRAGDRWLAYATNGDKGKINVQLAESRDLIHWTMAKDDKGARDAMPELPAWAKKGFTWAPEVVKTDLGYVLYFTARDKKSGLQCIGAAASADPAGPFVSAAAEPLVCQTGLGGTIDASPFRDSDGKLYLYYKNDGNNPAVRKPVKIYGQSLSADGLRITGEPAALLGTGAEWEANLIEAPTMVRRADGYTLLFSANDYAWQPTQRLSAYAIGYAACDGPLGPCTAPTDNPVLYSFNAPDVGCLSGPGHQAVFQGEDRRYIAFHAWAATPGCRPLDRRRYLYIAPLGWKGAKPMIGKSLRE